MKKVECLCPRLSLAAKLGIALTVAVAIHSPTPNLTFSQRGVEVPSMIVGAKSVLAQEIVKGCPRAEMLESYETKTYLVYICQTAQGDFFYRGVNKKNGDQINVMGVLSTDGGTYYSTNGSYTYWIDRRQLRITKHDRDIFAEPVWPQ